MNPKIRPTKWRSGAPVALLALTMALSACGGSDAEDGESIPGLAKSGTLTLASTGNFPPCTFTGDSGKVEGYSIDLGNEMADRLGLELASPTIDFVAELQGVKSGQYDLGDGCVNVTEERAKEFDYTVPLGSTTFVALTKEENTDRVTGLDNVEGLRIGVVEGSSRQVWAEAKESELGYEELTGYPGFSQAILDLQNDRIDLVLDDSVASNYFVEENPDAGLTIVGDGVEPTIFAMVMQKGNTEVQEAVNGTLSEMLADGTIGDLQEKWFGETLPTPASLDETGPWEPAPTS